MVSHFGGKTIWGYLGLILNIRKFVRLYKNIIKPSNWKSLNNNSILSLMTIQLTMPQLPTKQVATYS